MEAATALEADPAQAERGETDGERAADPDESGSEAPDDNPSRATDRGGDAVVVGEASSSGQTHERHASNTGSASDDSTRAASPDAGAPGRLEASAIQDVVREHRDELGFCFTWQLHQHPELGGRIVMEFVIGADGQVSEARVASDELDDEVVERCFVRVTERMEFPAPDGGGEVTVRYPFQLSAQDSDEE